MKLVKRRYQKDCGLWFIDVAAFGYKDENATKMAKMIRKELGIKARVMTDAATGFTYVFVPENDFEKVADFKPVWEFV